MAPSWIRRGEWPPDVRDADLVIHATPVRDEVLFELGRGQTLIDLPYPRTATAEAAAAAGARVLDGLEVLVAQGAASFELWTALEAPVDVAPIEREVRERGGDLRERPSLVGEGRALVQLARGDARRARRQPATRLRAAET